MNDVTSNIELYDSDFIPIEKVLEALNRKQKTYVNLESFRREIIQRFEDIGLIVQIKVYDTNVSDAYAFEINICDRITREEFDYDKQHYEVVNDILGIEPEKKGVTFKPPTDPADIHGPEHTHHHDEIDEAGPLHWKGHDK